MKNIFYLLFLIPTCLLAQKSESKAFKTFSEEFLIRTEDGRNIKMTYVRGYKLKKDVPWRSLLEDFTRDFSSVASTVPAYSDFEVYYRQNESLTVEQLQGVNVFNVGDSTGLKKVNLARISGRVVSLEIEVESLEELEATDYLGIVEKAIAGHKRAPYLLSNSYLAYDLRSGETINRAPAQRRLSYDAGVMGGFLNASPYVDLFSRMNFTWNAADYIYAKFSLMNYYDLDSLQSRSLGFPMLGYELKVADEKRSWFVGLEAGFVPQGWTPTGNIRSRLGLSLRTSDGFSFYITYIQEERDDSLSNIGFSFQGFTLGTRYRF